MPAPAYQLVVDVVTARCRPPRNGSAHPWRRVTRDGVVTVERAPGIARDAATRPLTPEERDARDRAVYEAVTAGEGCTSVATRLGTTKNAVVGMLSRYRVRHDIPSPPRAGSAEAPHRTAARNRALLEALLEGDTVPEVAERAGLSHDTVRRIRSRAVARGQLPPPRVMRPATGLALRTVAVPACTEVVRVPLVDVGPGQCRDIAGDGLCCCAPVVSGRSWCPAHLALYTAAPRRRAA